MNALRRFISCRGPVTSIRTDNGTNFVGAQKELQKSLKEMDHHRIQNALLKDGVKWTFNYRFGAHFGVSERLIKLMKKILVGRLVDWSIQHTCRWTHPPVMS